MISDRVWEQLKAALEEAKHSRAGAPAERSDRDFGYWGAKEQKSSIRKMSSDFLKGVECVPQMVIFDVVPQDFNVLKQSAI